MIDAAVEDNPFLAGVDPDLIHEPMPVEERLERAREAKKEKQESAKTTLLERAKAADLRGEERRKADYAIKELRRGRDPQDTAMLTDVLKQIMKRYERSRS